MAQITVKDTCLYCGEQLEPGVAVYMTAVELVDHHTWGSRDWEMVNGKWTSVTKKMKSGLLRILFKAQVKPKSAVHVNCFKELFPQHDFSNLDKYQ